LNSIPGTYGKNDRSEESLRLAGKFQFGFFPMRVGRRELTAQSEVNCTMRLFDVSSLSEFDGETVKVLAVLRGVNCADPLHDCKKAFEIG